LGAGRSGEGQSEQAEKTGNSKGLAKVFMGHAEIIEKRVLEGYCTKGLLGRRAKWQWEVLVEKY
jgi:hypothetical protein